MRRATEFSRRKDFAPIARWTVLRTPIRLTFITAKFGAFDSPVSLSNLADPQNGSLPSGLVNTCRPQPNPLVSSQPLPPSFRTTALSNPPD